MPKVSSIHPCELIRSLIGKVRTNWEISIICLFGTLIAVIGLSDNIKLCLRLVVLVISLLSLLCLIEEAKEYIKMRTPLLFILLLFSALVTICFLGYYCHLDPYITMQTKTDFFNLVCADDKLETLCIKLGVPILTFTGGSFVAELVAFHKQEGNQTIRKNLSSESR